jgi:hypothetical protein
MTLSMKFLNVWVKLALASFAPRPQRTRRAESAAELSDYRKRDIGIDEGRPSA